MTRWDWTRLEGSAEMLRYMRRDLATLDAVIARTPHRRVAVQAGGCLGIFPRRLAETFQVVYTFEPDPENFATLCRNATDRNIVKFQAALGDDRRLVTISHTRRSTKPGRAHEGIRHVEGAGPIPTLRIDDLALPICDLVYLDVEGHELFALRGAAETIARCRPVIACEMNEMMGYVGVTEDQILGQFDGLGYRHAVTLGADRLFLPHEMDRAA